MRLAGRVAGSLVAAAAQKNMNAPENFEVMEGYCCYRLSGHGRLAEAASKVIEVISFSQEQGMRNLLIDTTSWTGHESPDTLARYDVAQAFADAARRSAVKLAMVVRPEMMDPDKFEVTVARNRGLVGNVFDSEKDALAWLLDPTIG